MSAGPWEVPWHSTRPQPSGTPARSGPVLTLDLVTETEHTGNRTPSERGSDEPVLRVIVTSFVVLAAASVIVGFAP